MARSVCETCIYSIRCETWAEWKCKLKECRIHGSKTSCSTYKKRDSNFKESKCQCEDCLKNELLWDEEED